MFTYVQSEPALWTVGFFRPDGKWLPSKDFDKEEDAIAYMRFLNGAPDSSTPGPVTPPSSASSSSNGGQAEHFATAGKKEGQPAAKK